MRVRFGSAMRRLGSALVLALLTGCADGAFSLDALKPKAARAPEPTPAAARPVDPLLADTVGSLALLAGVEGQRVRGFGLVIGLGENGSVDCPSTVRDYLVEQLTRDLLPDRPEAGRPRISPERLIDSPDTAPVEVIALIPPGAPRGTLVDVMVVAVQGTQTRSLEGGLLLPTAMRIVDAAASGRGLLTGQVVARARGPVFTNPFTGELEQSAGDPRSGVILGGAVTTEERTSRFVLTEPSYSRARRIEQRLNERFGQSPRTAEALSQSYVTLHTPPACAEFPEQFLQLAAYVYLESQPAFIDRKLQDLATRVAQPAADLEKIALAWEAAGRVALRAVQPLYAHDDPAVAFHAARAGLRLKDSSALNVLGAIAGQRGNPLRLLAIRELANCGFASAATMLAPLVNDPDQELRIAAYEGLRRHRHPAVRPRNFSCALDPTQLNFTLDIVESTGSPMIYVRRTRAPRIAIFGPRLSVETPMFFVQPDERVTINARDASAELVVYGRSPGRRTLSQEINIPPRVADLVAALGDVPLTDEIKRLRGLGLTYGQVVSVLYSLTRDGTIPVPLVIEQTPLTDLLGPEALPERPEGDEPPALPDEPAAETESPAEPERLESGAKP